jgi:hypothetical protein
MASATAITHPNRRFTSENHAITHEMLGAAERLALAGSA